MKSSALDREIEKVVEEINTLEAVRARLCAVRANDGDAIDGDVPKVRRGRKKKAGLPQATPPASEANHRQAAGEKL